MARRVYGDFDAELLLRLANRTDITSTMRGFFLRDAYLDVCNLFKHVQLEAVTTTQVILIATDTLTPNVTDFWYPTLIRNRTDGWEIVLDSQQRIERPNVKPTAPPYKYYWYAGQFVFDTLANAQKATKIWYKKIPAAWTAGTSPVIDELFDPLIIMRAAKIGFETVRNLAEAQIEEKLFDQYAVQKKLPLESARLNDYRQGWKVRLK